MNFKILRALSLALAIGFLSSLAFGQTHECSELFREDPIDRNYREMHAGFQQREELLSILRSVSESEKFDFYTKSGRETFAARLNSKVAKTNLESISVLRVFRGPFGETEVEFAFHNRRSGSGTHSNEFVRLDLIPQHDKFWRTEKAVGILRILRGIKKAGARIQFYDQLENVFLDGTLKDVEYGAEYFASGDAIHSIEALHILDDTGQTTVHLIDTIAPDSIRVLPRLKADGFSDSIRALPHLK